MSSCCYCRDSGCVFLLQAERVSMSWKGGCGPASLVDPCSAGAVGKGSHLRAKRQVGTLFLVKGARCHTTQALSTSI